jgi:hypothetical protein
MPVSGMAPGRTEAARPNLAAFPADWTEFAPELGRQPRFGETAQTDDVLKLLNERRA